MRFQPARLFRVALAAGLGVSALLYFLWSWRWPLVGDSSLIHYIAWLIERGWAPYRQIADMNMPGAYLVEMAAMRVFGTGALAWRLYDFSLMAAAALSFLVIARRPRADVAPGAGGPVHEGFIVMDGSGRWLARLPGAPSMTALRSWVGSEDGCLAGLFAACLFILIHGRDGLAQGGQRDLTMAVCLIVATALLLVSVRGVSACGDPGCVGSLWAAAAFGLFSGVALTIKPTALPLTLAQLALAACVLRAHGGRERESRQDRQCKRPPRPWLGHVAAALAGYLVAPVAALAFLLRERAFTAFLDNLHGLDLYYAGLAHRPPGFLLLHSVSPLLPLVLLWFAVLALRFPAARPGRAHTAPGSEHTAPGSERSALDNRHTALGSERSAFDWGRTALGSERSALGSEHTALGSERSPLGWESTPLGWESTALGSERSALDWERSALGWGRTALGSERSALGWERSALGWERSALLIGAIFGLVSYLVQARGFPYYRYPLLIFLLPLMAIDFIRALPAKRSVPEASCPPRIKAAGWLAMAALAFGGFFLAPQSAVLVHRYRWWQTDFISSLEQNLDTLGGRRLSGHIQCIDSISGCGNVLYRMRLQPANGLLVDFPLFGADSVSFVRRTRQRFLAAINASPPPVIVVTSALYVDGPGNYRKLARWPAFAAFLAAHYTLYAEWSPTRVTRWWGRAETPAGYRIYLLRPRH